MIILYRMLTLDSHKSKKSLFSGPTRTLRVPKVCHQRRCQRKFAAILSGSYPVEAYERNSEIQYDGDIFHWGFQIGEFEPRNKWFKLGLDASSDRAKLGQLLIATDAENAPTANQPPTTMVTDYLTALRKHVEVVLHHKLTADFLKSTPIRYILTVPAIWPEAAEAKTRACAEKAGMGKASELQIISEPEAAATYAVYQMKQQDVTEGKTFVLADAGGGTVDLISYTISQLEPSFEMMEAVPGSGAFAGSSFLNRRFQDFLRKRFRNDPAWNEDAIEEV